MNPNFKPHHRRRKSNNYNPLDLQLDNDPEKEIVVGYDKDTVRLVDNLKSYDPNTREMATIALAQLNFSDENILKGIIEQGIIPLLIERLVDTNHQIVLNSLLALLNLCESEQKIDGTDLAYRVFQAGILTVADSILITLVKQMLNEQNQNKSVKVQMLMIEYMYKIASALAEALDEEHLLSITQSKLTNESIGLFLTINSNEILTGIASYWHVLAESSLEVCKRIAGAKEILERCVVLVNDKSASAELKAYISGMLFNIITKLDTMNVEIPNKLALSEMILSTIFDIISIQILDEINNLVKMHELMAPQARKGKVNVKEAMKEDIKTHPSEMANLIDEDETAESTIPNEKIEETKGEWTDLQFKEAVKIWQDSAAAIEICLGLLINIFEVEDEEAEFEDAGEIESDDEQQIMEMGKKASITTEASKPRTEFFQKIVSNEIKEKLLKNLVDKCKHVSVEHYEFLTELNLTNLLFRCNRIIEFAFSALMNLCINSIYKQLPSGSDSAGVIKFSTELVNFLWSEFKFYIEIIYNQTLEAPEEEEKNNSKKDKKAIRQEIDHEKVQVNEILNFLLLVLSKSPPEVAANISIYEVLHAKKALFHILDQQTKLYLIELIGVKASPKNKMSIQDNVLVADHLIEVLKMDDVMLIGEALNALFDIYPDVDYDVVFKEKNLLTILNFGYNVFKEKIKAARKDLTNEDISTLKQHLMNLKRFIKYKKESMI